MCRTWTFEFLKICLSNMESLCERRSLNKWNSGNWTWTFFAPSLLCSLEDVNLQARCAKTQIRSVCFDELFRHHFLKGEVAFQVTCSGGYEKYIEISGTLERLVQGTCAYFCDLLWRCCRKMMFCVCNILGFIISPYVCTLSHDLQDSPSTFFEQTLSLFTWADLVKENTLCVIP